MIRDGDGRKSHVIQCARKYEQKMIKIADTRDEGKEIATSAASVATVPGAFSQWGNDATLISLAKSPSQGRPVSSGTRALSFYRRKLYGCSFSFFYSFSLFLSLSQAINSSLTLAIIIFHSPSLVSCQKSSPFSLYAGHYRYFDVRKLSRTIRAIFDICS